MTLLGALACGPAAPAEIDAVDSMVLYDGRDVVLDAGVRDARGRLLPDAVVDVVASSDPSVLELTEGGWRCVRSGPAVVSLGVESVLHDVAVQCLLVDRIVVEPAVIDAVLDTTDGVVEAAELPALSIAVVDSDARPLDVPLRVTSADDRIVRVGPGDVLELRAFGATEVEVVAGDTRVAVPVRVGVVHRRGSLAIGEGDQESVQLPPGRWRWVLTADAPVIATAGACRDVGASIDRTCDLPDGASLLLESRLPGVRRAAILVERLPELSSSTPPSGSP
ncbi:MAG: hypothetical protein GY913_20265 [Proteobacteria bacterium]|nr:hypothetical protein [Pseudomonadota bacterium]MCP4919242.1 hypothetical protein [Pseudomonadota bacterium]